MTAWAIHRSLGDFLNPLKEVCWGMVLRPGMGNTIWPRARILVFLAMRIPISELRFLTGNMKPKMKVSQGGQIPNLTLENHLQMNALLVWSSARLVASLAIGIPIPETRLRPGSVKPK